MLFLKLGNLIALVLFFLNSVFCKVEAAKKEGEFQVNTIHQIHTTIINQYYLINNLKPQTPLTEETMFTRFYETLREFYLVWCMGSEVKNYQDLVESDACDTDFEFPSSYLYLLKILKEDMVTPCAKKHEIKLKWILLLSFSVRLTFLLDNFSKFRYTTLLSREEDKKATVLFLYMTGYLQLNKKNKIAISSECIDNPIFNLLKKLCLGKYLQTTKSELENYLSYYEDQLELLVSKKNMYSRYLPESLVITLLSLYSLLRIRIFQVTLGSVLVGLSLTMTSFCLICAIHQFFVGSRVILVPLIDDYSGWLNV